MNGTDRNFVFRVLHNEVSVVCIDSNPRPAAFCNQEKAIKGVRRASRSSTHLRQEGSLGSRNV